MQRYHAASCTSAVNNNVIDSSTRNTSRVDSSSLPTNLSLNPRRQLQQPPYKLKCDKEPLNSGLGPPDFHPPTPNCPEGTLTGEYVQCGYKETVDGLEEAREISLSEIQTFTKPLILKCKEAIRKCHRAINESRAQKRKAGQVYGVPLSGTLLTKSSIFPEQKSCGEEFRRKWVESLSQNNKRLRSLADHVPHGYRKRSLLEVLTRNNVPLLRATWFVKVAYLNQIHPASSSLPDKTHHSRSEQWTKDVVDYLRYLLDEIVSRHSSHSNLHIRDRSPQMVYAGSVQHKSDSALAASNVEEASLHFKWWYVVRIIQWHHAEGLLIPSLIIDWVLNQLQEKGLLGILQLVLPIIYGVIETVILSQTYVRNLVGIALRFIREPSPGGSDLVDNSRRAYTISALVEMLRYLILAVPDTFVAFDCFPLPSCVIFNVVNDVSFSSKFIEDGRKKNNDVAEVACVLGDKGPEVQSEYLSVELVVSSIKKRAESLARASRPGHIGHNVAKAVQALDDALIKGDVEVSCNYIFDHLFNRAFDESWIKDVSSCLRSTLKWIGTVRSSIMCSVFFLCEWATCDFRDFRAGSPHGMKFTGRRDFTQIYIAIRLLKLKDLKSSHHCKNGGNPEFNCQAGASGQVVNSSRRVPAENEVRNGLKCEEGSTKVLLDIFESPGPLHDIIVCWIDQHEVQSREGLTRLQLLLIELVRFGIFYPQAYVRQLIVSGIMDMNGPLVDQARQKRHHNILKQLPAPYIRDALEEAQITEVSLLSESMLIYAKERRFVLQGLRGYHKVPNNVNISSWKQKHNSSPGGGGTSPDQHKPFQSAVIPLYVKNTSLSAELEELKASISALLQLSNSNSKPIVDGIDECQGSIKRSLGSHSHKMDTEEGTLGCEECKRAKRQKLSDERSPSLQGCLSNASDDEENWWVRKGQKSLESFKVDPPLKPSKPVSRGRQKIVRKTQSLAQLAAARIEGSQGASTSHVCDSRVSCPYHRTGAEGDALKSMNRFRLSHSVDLVSIGKVLKQLRFVEKRTITIWLVAMVRQVLEETEKNAMKMNQYGRPFPTVDDQSPVRWKLGEDELCNILYLMDACNDLVLAARFLLWLLPKVQTSSTIHGGRNILMPPRNVENHACFVGEGFLLTSIRRYENVLVAADLIPETLSATMRRAAVVIASNGRVSGSVSLDYACHLLKRYGNVPSVVEWEKNFKASFDKRLISELESRRSVDGEFGFPLGVPAGVEDLDDFLRQKISGIRLSRVGLSMKEIVQRHIDEVFHYSYGKERKLFGSGTTKNPPLDKGDDGNQIAQQIVMGLMECMRQTGGAAQEGDPMLVSSVVSAVVTNVGLFIAKIPDLTLSSNHPKFSSTSGSLDFARRILRIHITCLCLLKDALGERQSRVFQIALATEASSALGHVFTPPKAPRSQYQLSPETHDSNTTFSNENLNNSTKLGLGRATKTAAAVSALVLGAILHGVASLERMITVFRMKEGLDLTQFVRSMRSNSNGNARSMGASKMDNMFEVSVHWFRVLVGNCRTVSDGFIVDLLGEASMVALSRMQRTLPLKLVLPPAYSIFAFVIWRTFIFNVSVVIRDDIHQLYQSLTSAITDAIRHLPFRDVCLRDTRGFYEFVAADATDSEFAAMLHSSGLGLHLKAMAFVPLRARLFLNAVVDCKMPQPILTPDDWNRLSNQGESKVHGMDNVMRLRDKLVYVLDTLQPAKFHWQWVELRLLLNEQALIEKLDAHDSSLTEAIRSLSPGPDKTAASENENNFIEIILTRLLVRPDAAPLFSEVVHLFGRSLEDSMLLQAKWFLGGLDVLFGRKSIRQRLVNIAENKGLSTKAQFSRPWGWSSSSSDLLSVKGDKRKVEVSSIEEGEVVDEGIDFKQFGKGSTQFLDVEGFIAIQEHITERAFIELVLPCIDQSSNDLRNTFANDLIKQMNDIEQQMNSVTRGSTKQSGIVNSGVEGPTSKSNNRKGMRGGSPGLARRPIATTDIVPASPTALRASISLRLQFLLGLLPIICADGEPSGRNMRHVLASVILRLLGSRVVHEETEPLSLPTLNGLKSMADAACGATIFITNEGLFDHLLLVLHGLLSGCRPSWLTIKSGRKSSTESKRDLTLFDREVAESLQSELDHMQLPDTVRWRIQTAMPFLYPSKRWSIYCQPPSISPDAIASLQSNISVFPGNSSLSQKNLASLARSASTALGKAKPYTLQQDLDMEVDPWTFLEDGADSCQSSSNTAVVGSGEHANPKAPSWLRGTVRVRRTDLTYIGAVDEDS